MPRNNKQKMLDLLLTLYATSECSKSKVQSTTIILQKVLFLTALELKAKRRLALGQTFYRWDWGPMSDELYQDIDDLAKLGLIDKDGDNVNLTDDGEYVLREIKEIYEENELFIHPIKKNAAKIESLDELLDEVYELEVPVEDLDEIMKIKDIPVGAEMVSPLWEDEAEEKIQLDPSWIATLDLLLDPKAHKSAMRALSEAKKGKFFPLEV